MNQLNMMQQMMGMGMDPMMANNMGGNPQEMSSMGMNLFNGMYPGMMPPNNQGQNLNQMNMGEKSNNENNDQ